MLAFDADALAPSLADEIRYASQWVSQEITSKRAYLDYIRPKLKSIKASGSIVWAESDHHDREVPGPCVILAQEDKGDLEGVVVGEVANGRLVRLDQCGAPSSWSARRPSVYPRRVK